MDSLRVFDDVFKYPIIFLFKILRKYYNLKHEIGFNTYLTENLNNSLLKIH